MLTRLLRHLTTREPPQTRPLPGSSQVRNEAGGFTWAVDDWTRLDRFLVLGADGGTYYASERTLTLESADVVLRCVAADGTRAVRRVVEISASGRAPKNDPAILALAIALKRGDLETRRAAREAVPKVCRIGTHLFSLAEAVRALGGWGRGTQAAFGGWYTGRDAAEVAFQAVKYGQRGGWSHRDVLRMAHVRPPGAEHDAVFRWIVKGWEGVLPDDAPDGALRRIWAAEQARRATSADAVVRLVRAHDLPREAVPTELLNDPVVWEALLERMPLTALLRNLGKMTAIGLVSPMSEATRAVVARLGDAGALRRARVHPLAVLVALTTYRSGRGVRGKLAWTPVQQVVDALDGAFHGAFGNVPSSGRRWMLGLDVSGSMGCGRIAGLAVITPRVAAAAMAMVTARVEPEHEIVAFAGELVRLGISPQQRLDDVLDRTDALPFGRTDCALPMLYALERRIPVDVFVVYTDSETWAGDVHPSRALRRYRDRMGIGAKLVVVGMTSNGFTIADPDDSGMLDVVGFDLAAPQLLRDFATA